MSWRVRAGQLLGAAAIAAVLPLAAQQPTFRSSGVVVPVFVTVTDAQQRLVTDLAEDDFEIFDNDKPQPLSVFESRYRPISVIVLLDTSLSMTGNLRLVREAAEQFVLRLVPEDKAKVGAFHDRIEISTEFTNDRDALVGDIKNLHFGNSTRLYDALAMGIDDLEAVQDRRVILVLTDGVDEGSHIGANEVLERARAEEVMVYAVGLESVLFNGQVRTKPDSGLKKIAAETGGGFFMLDKTGELGKTFTRVAQELHNQYILGFTPGNLDNKVHKVAVKLKRSGLTARARKSYLARPKTSKDAPKNGRDGQKSGGS
jgi:Ca-activated chloride channel family protein